MCVYINVAKQYLSFAVINFTQIPFTLSLRLNFTDMLQIDHDTGRKGGGDELKKKKGK